MKWSILLCFLLALNFSQAQTYSDGWALGFGLTSPRMFGDVFAESFDYGGHFFVQRDFDEVSSLRLKLDYLHFSSKGFLLTPPQKKGPENTTIGLGWDYLYTFSSCKPLKLYGGAGGSALYYTLKNAVGTKNNSTIGELAVRFIAGGKLALDKDWDLRAEVSMDQVSTDRFDGVFQKGGGLFGGNLDSYLTAEFGVTYYIDRGPETNYCEAHGMTKPQDAASGTDYQKIEDIVKKYAQQPATDVDYNKIEDIVKRNVPTSASFDSKSGSVNPHGNWMLIGVNFDANKSTFRPEAYPILINAAQILLANNALKVQIEGHTDNVGSVAANQKLSEQRADAVKRFLISKGVEESRLSTIGYGATKPISDNKTVQGKAFNRRIEFKVVD